MDKRYQVFVSSTFADLKDERQKVIQTLMGMDCIPAGMELFPAADEDQLNFIKRVIDDCDYYLLIIGGRYGSVTSQGVSYTEQEFDYAVEKGLRVLAFLHQDPKSIVSGKTDSDPLLAKRLGEFRAKVQAGRLVNYWTRADELPGLVALSLPKTIKTYPAVGWIRANNGTSEELLLQINNLRLENESLRLKMTEGSSSQALGVSDIAGMDERIALECRARSSLSDDWVNWEANISWAEIFNAIAPHIMTNPADSDMPVRLGNAIRRFIKGDSKSSRLIDDDFQTVKIQLLSLGLITLTPSGGTVGAPLLWGLTPKGMNEMIQRRTVRTADRD